MQLVPSTTVAPQVIPPAISLVRSARQPRDDTNGEWVNGFSFLPEPNTPGWTDDMCLQIVTSDITATSGQNPQNIPNIPAPNWYPPVHRAWDRCAPYGYEVHDYQARAVQAITNALPKRIEYEFWSGTRAQGSSYPNIYLAHPRCNVLVNGSPVSMKRAFYELEQAIADCGSGGQGMIHCRREAMPQLPNVRRDGNLMKTGVDTIVVPGVGYPNIGPAGQANANPTAGLTWLYATGPVDVRIDNKVLVYPDPSDYPSKQAFITAAMDRTVNDVIVRGEQIAVAAWDGQCHFAVLATLDT